MIKGKKENKNKVWHNDTEYEGEEIAIKSNDHGHDQRSRSEEVSL